jgi:hypothetical protein
LIVVWSRYFCFVRAWNFSEFLSKNSFEVPLASRCALEFSGAETPRDHRSARGSCAALALVLALVAGCTSEQNDPSRTQTVSATNHPFFPIAAGATHAISATMTCDACHAPGGQSFTDVSCTTCHTHETAVTDRLHLSVGMYSNDSHACLTCHPASDKFAFDHASINSQCAMCHDVGAAFASLPQAGFTHPDMLGQDCATCHNTSRWDQASGGPTQNASDPVHDVVLDALVPTWSTTTIAAVSPLHQVLPMTMNHASTEIDPSALSTCNNCHVGATAGVFFPGTLHSSLANLTLPQPSACGSCHSSAAPAGFVGPLAASPARTPATGEMRHDAVAWSSGAPTTTKLVSSNCGLCHAAPGVTSSSWTTSAAGTSPVLFHAALDAAGQPQPASCIDCHANTRPGGVLDSTNSHLGAPLVYDHSAPEALGDCVSCHAKSATPPFNSWAAGAFHTPGSATPSTCLPCHAADRPATNTGWLSTGYTSSPFDYGTNAAGVTHGAGLDCVSCHANAGSGAWGVNQNWAAGHFTHGPGTPSATACITCHSTQRPDLVLGVSPAVTAVGFDHSTQGSGDCFGCHQATVQANRYVDYTNASTGKLPNGDWKGGAPYPGSTLATTPADAFTVTQLKLNRSASNLVTSVTPTSATLYNGMLHTSSVLPASLQAGPTGSPNNNVCWHCHTHSGTTVTSFNGGKFHASLDTFSSTPGGAVAPLPQPVDRCSDCHPQAQPKDVVQRAGNDLLSMDHSARFTAVVTINGKSASAVTDLDCSTCHGPAGSTWASGTFHANIGTAQPSDCVTCHYPLMADAAKADVASARDFSMKHRSATLSLQTCDTCHTAALMNAKQAPTASTLWKTGALHANVPSQPTLCVDCHASSQPDAGTLTQGSVVYALPLGGTATNGGQWMNHGSGFVAGKDCATCHATDAKRTGAAWNKGDAFHVPVPGVSRCIECHGQAGAQNNLPSGLTNASTISAFSSTADQILHTDVNVAGKECITCHTQAGASMGTAAGKEWAQAKFHLNFSATSPLVMNGTTGRCSNCHLAQKPGPSFTAQDHSTFTNAPGTEDCSTCHAWPGTGTSASPNWLGAAGAPQQVTLGGFTVTSPPAASGTTEAPLAIAHPTVPSGEACTACHTSSGGGTPAFGYDHSSPLIGTQCAACHEAGSTLIGAVWNGATAEAQGTGDTRPYTLGSVTVQYQGGMVASAPNHFFPVDCDQCHVTPGGNGTTTTGAAYSAAWSFPHDTPRMTNPTTCVMCHTTGIPGAPTGPANDPMKNVTVSAGVPRFSGTTMTSLTPQSETLTMSMSHSSTDVPAAVLNTCSNCHPTASTGVYYPGILHSSLANLAVAEPAKCSSCHNGAAPTGLVGPTATSPARSPASGEMKHDAVAWLNGAPTSTALVSTECSLCHASPSATLDATWGMDRGGSAPAKFHTALAAGAQPQPSSCLDCHANTRPTSVLTSGSAVLPAGVSFDHAAASASGDCITCHVKSTQAPFSSWSGGLFHLAGSTTPATCLPCHSGERPASTSGWKSTIYAQTPFDYGTNTNGVTHGDGQDCATCHTGPGTGAWGGTQNWVGGTFVHGPSTPSASTCVACHASQRPDLVLGASQANTALGFDHSTNGAGDCFGCHGATVAAGSYAHYDSPSTGTLPGGDWKGGQQYPGSTITSSTDQLVTLSTLTLSRSGALVTGITSSSQTLYNGMLHTSTVLPAALNAGPTSSPDSTKCWHCHTHSGTTVSSFKNGQYHASLTGYSATPGGSVVPFAQPSTQCADCHAQMLPVAIVEQAGSELQAMDHSAQFTAAVTLGGKSVTAVSQADCSVCHRSPGGAWSDGVFHANIGGAQPKDCVSCHYPLMADAAKSDTASTRNFTMKHGSAQLTSQACATCHTSALANSTNTSHASTLWATGALHANIGTQPAACDDCHLVSEPDAGTSTQSSVTYAFTLGGTSTNGGQWMNHGSSYVAGKDCALCHAADAKASGAAWSKSDVFHPKAGTVTTCQNCHGLANGEGSVAGTKNNLPGALTSSTTVSSAAGAAGTGVAAGTLDQILHTDVNVSAFDCTVCHTQAGTTWAQATFHANFNASRALVMNTTTGRCSNCHLNVKPTSAFTQFDHSGFTSASGSEDCSSCHTWPGTGTASAPNWLGAVGVPATLNVGGFTIPNPPGTGTTEPPVAGLPHPTVGSTACTACHTTSAGGRPALGYDHASTVMATRCDSCHEAGTTLVGTVWNGSASQSGGAGDSRPWTISGLVPSFNGNTRALTNGFNHFFGVDCHECHAKPTGIATTSTSTTYTSRWKFHHTTSNMTNPGTCNMCHHSPNNIPN